jgi:hypothetical protein
MASAGLQIDADESVFIMQLHRRGRLLDKMFKNAVIDALSKTYENAKSGPVTRSSSGPSVTASNLSFKLNASSSCSDILLGTHTHTHTHTHGKSAIISVTPTQRAFNPEGIASIQARVEGGVWDVESGDKALPHLSVMQDAPLGDGGDGTETWTETGSVVNLKVGLFSDGPKQIEVHLAPIKSKVFCLSVTLSLPVCALSFCLSHLFLSRSLSPERALSLCASVLVYVSIWQKSTCARMRRLLQTQPHHQYHTLQFTLLAYTLKRSHRHNDICFYVYGRANTYIHIYI